MPPKLAQIAGTPVNPAADQTRLAELTSSKAPPNAPTGPRAHHHLTTLSPAAALLVDEYDNLALLQPRSQPHTKAVQDRMLAIQSELAVQTAISAREASFPSAVSSSGPRLATPTSSMFTMDRRASDSPGGQLRAAAPEFTPGSADADRTIARKSSSVDLHAVADHAERRKSREIDPNITNNTVGAFSGPGAANFEFQIPSGVTVPTVCVTTASPNNNITDNTTKTGGRVHNGAHQAPDMAQSHNAFNQQHTQTNAAQAKAQHQNQKPAQQQFNGQHTPGMSSHSGDQVAGHGQMGYNTQNPAQGHFAQMFAHLPPGFHKPSGIHGAPQPGFNQYHQAFPPLGAAQQAQAQAHLQSVFNASAQSHQQQLQTQHQAQMQHNGMGEPFGDPNHYMINITDRNAFLAQQGHLGQNQHTQGFDAAFNFGNPLYAQQQGIQPPPGFAQFGTQHQGPQGGSLIATFQGHGAAHGVVMSHPPAQDQTQHVAHTHHAGVGPGNVQGQGFEQAQGQPHPSARKSSNTTEPTRAAPPSAENKPAATAAAKGKTIGGTWYPAGKSPAELKGAKKSANPYDKFGKQVADYKFTPASPSWIQTSHELTGKWSTLPPHEGTPPQALRLARLVEKDASELTPAELYEREFGLKAQNSGNDFGPFGGQGGQGGLNYGAPILPGEQFNSFGAPLGGGMGGKGMGPVDIHEGDPNHMSRNEMAHLAGFFDKVLKPGKQRKIWGYGDDEGQGDDEDSDEDGNDGGNNDGPGNKTPRANDRQVSQPNAREPSLMEQRFGPRPPPASLQGQHQFQRKQKPAPLGMAQEPIPLAQQLGLVTPASTGQQPILPSAMPTRHVSHGVTNIFNRGTGANASSELDPGRRLFSQQQAQTPGQRQPSTHPTSHGPIAQPSGTAIAHMWKSSNQAIRDDYKYVSNQAQHLGFSASPAFPESPAQYAAVRADQKNRAAEQLKRVVSEKEAALTEEGRRRKEMLESANKAAYEWAAKHIPHAQAQAHAGTPSGDARGPSQSQGHAQPQFKEETQRQADDLFRNIMSAQGVHVAGVPVIDPKDFHKYHLTASGRPSRYSPKLLVKYAHEAQPAPFQSAAPGAAGVTVRTNTVDAVAMLGRIHGAGGGGGGGAHGMQLSEVPILNRSMSIVMTGKEKQGSEAPSPDAYGGLSGARPVPGPVASMFGDDFAKALGQYRFQNLYNADSKPSMGNGGGEGGPSKGDGRGEGAGGGQKN